LHELLCDRADSSGTRNSDEYPHRGLRYDGGKAPEMRSWEEEMSDQNIVECVLCRKKKESPRHDGNWNWSRVCPECESFWELGKRAAKASRADGKDHEVLVPSLVPMSPKLGDVSGPVEIKGLDIIAAMGGASIRGTAMGSRFGGSGERMSIVSSQDKDDWEYISGGSLPVKVPNSRAVAMKKIFTAFLNALAKARVEGFDEGRNLLLGLSKGEVSLDTFSEQADNSRAGIKPKKRWG
jgi:hypothetical protein